jgi:hypothetical protein
MSVRFIFSEKNSDWEKVKGAYTSRKRRTSDYAQSSSAFNSLDAR